jgi:hypothetical protein
MKNRLLTKEATIGKVREGDEQHRRRQEKQPRGDVVAKRDALSQGSGK